MATKKAPSPQHSPLNRQRQSLQYSRRNASAPAHRRPTMRRSSAVASAAVAAIIGLSLLLSSSSSAEALRPSPPSVASSPPRHALVTSTIPRGGGNAKAEHVALSVKGGGGKKQKKEGKDAAVANIVGGGTASMTNLILNLVKAVVGVGVMSLPQGITSFGDAPSAVLPAALLVALMGATSAYGFSLIGRTCAYTGSSSYRQAWDRAVSERSSWTVAVACAAKGFFAVLAYSMGLADTFRGIFQSLGKDVSRTNSLLLVTALFLLPLCSLKNLSALAPFSLLGILAMLFAGAAMGVRYLGGDYAVGAAAEAAAEGAAEAASAGGKYLADLAAEHAPKFGTRGGLGCVFHPNVFVFVCMLSTAFMAHFNAPKFYLELENNTVSRFNAVVSTSFAASVVIQAAIMAVGYLTFGANSAGLVLNNYSPKDALISVARIAVAFSVVFTYPMPFAGCRDGVLDLMNVPPEKRTDAFVNTVTVTLLGLVTMAALKLTDISFVLGFGGATLGNALIYVFPGIMFRGAIKAMVSKAEKDGGDTKGLKREANLAAVHALLGVVLGTLGAVYAVKGVGGGH